MQKKDDGCDLSLALEEVLIKNESHRDLLDFIYKKPYTNKHFKNLIIALNENHKTSESFFEKLKILKFINK